MNKLLAALIAGLFAVGSFAAASAPEAAAPAKEKADKATKNGKKYCLILSNIIQKYEIKLLKSINYFSPGSRSV
jgi:hypothetical protein